MGCILAQYVGICILQGDHMADNNHQWLLHNHKLGEADNRAREASLPKMESSTPLARFMKTYRSN